MKKIILFFLIIVLVQFYSYGQTTRTVGASGADYSTLKAAFDAINAGTLTGNIVLRVVQNTTETATAVLNANGTGGAIYSSLRIYPASSGISISGSLVTPLIDLNGADNVIIDGRVNESGSAIDLVIRNSSTSNAAGTSTIRFINDSKNNIVRYCTIKGSSTSSSGGIFFFSTSSITDGNDANTISNNNITGDDAGRPVNVIYSLGSSGKFNSENTISDNNFYNFLRPGSASNGIYLYSYSSTWTITGNSFYETSSFVPTSSADYYIIRVSYSSSSGFIVNNNYIGGNSAGSNGTWTKTNANNNAFTAIYISAGLGTVNSVQNNTIRGFNWSNSGNKTWTAIHLAAGSIDIGTGSWNTIGSDTGTGSITVTGGGSSVSQVYGINIETGGDVNCENNFIGSITGANSSSNATSVCAIRKSASSGSTLINNNSIGSASTANSIQASSAAGSSIQDVIAIANYGIGDVTISGNSISNLSNATTNTDGSITGLFNDGGDGINRVYLNFIHSLSATGGSSTSSIYGIRVIGGIITYFNNIISLGGNTSSIINGILVSNGDTRLYFNTVYISGSPSSGSENTYAINDADDSEFDDFRNNIFVNTRSNNGASGNHYSINLSGSSLTIDYNDYHVSGTGTILGYLGGNISNLADWQSATGKDANSLNLNPSFSLAGGTTADNYKLNTDLPGTPIQEYDTDFGLNGRGSTPAMGAWERLVNKWVGSISTNWGTAGNWSEGIVPGTDAQIFFDDAPQRHCYLNQNVSVSNITINQSTYRLVTNGHRLTVKGSLVLSNGAQIDASASGSTVEFAGSVAQTIPSGAFYNDQIFNLTINNPGNVVLNGTLNILGTLSRVNGLLDASGNSLDFIFGGSQAQTIENNRFLNNRIYNLTIDNSIGVTLNTDFTVDNNMVINSGKVFTISATRLLTVNGNLTNNAGIPGLIIKSDGAGDGKLLNNSASVPASVELYLTGGPVSTNVGRYHYFVPPVSSVTLSSGIPTIDNVKTALSITNFNGYLLSFDETKATTSKTLGWQYFDGYGGDTPFSSLESGRGYNLYLTANDKLTFRGTLNSLQHVFDLSYTPAIGNPGWNLVGNPYPCNYNLNGVAGLGTVINGISNSVYYNNNGEYYIYNVLLKVGNSADGTPTGIYSDIVPPMTGFFVRLSDAVTSLTFPVTSKVSTAGDTRAVHKGYSAKSEVKADPAFPYLRLQLSKDANTDEAIVLLLDDATESYNEHYDAFKMIGSNAVIPRISSEIAGTSYFMKAVAPPTTSPAIIPLKIVVKESGTHTITASDFKNFGSTSVVLKHGIVQTPITEGADYTFTSVPGTLTDFSLVIGSSPTDVEIVPEGNFKAWYSNNSIFIYCPPQIPAGNGTMSIYNLQGKKVIENTGVMINPGETINVTANISKGMYIVHLDAGNKPFVLKIIVL